jgi:cytochrome P450
VCDATVDPGAELAGGAHAGRVDPQPSVHRPASHHEAIDVRATDEPVGLRRIDAREQSPGAARGHRHLAVDQEREPAEHALLGDAALALEQIPDPIGELLVVRHAREGTETATPRDVWHGTAMASGPLTIDLRDPEFWQDPYPALRAARARNRTARTTAGEPVLLAADDFDVVHTDGAFAQLGLDALERLGMDDGPFHEWRGRTMAANDGAVHARLRGTVNRAFTSRRVEHLRERLHEHARRTLDVLCSAGEVDVVDYARDLPLWLVCEFLGLPQDARVEIDGFLAGTEEAFTDPLTSDARRHAEDGIVALSRFVETLVATRESEPEEDLVSDLLDAERAGQIDRAELVALAVNVIGGAVGSSRAAIANSLLVLLRHPEQARWVAADHGRIAGAVEECLRFHPPFRSGRRKTTAAVTRFDIDLPAGATVFLARQAANRDPSRWSDPDRFDVTRPVERHYSFGYGPHFCLGQAIARLDVQTSVWSFLTACPGARLVTVEPRRIPFTPDEQLESVLVALR